MLLPNNKLAGRYGSQLLDLLPWKHYKPRRWGCLYAIEHGADTIWDFDDDNVLKPGKQPSVPSSNIFKVAWAQAKIAQHLIHILAWVALQQQILRCRHPGPVVLPLDLIGRPCNYTLAPADTVGPEVVQSLG